MEKVEKKYEEKEEATALEEAVEYEKEGGGHALAFRILAATEAVHASFAARRQKK